MNSKDKMKNQIPERSFGHCRWCGADNVRLHYLMCSDCFRLSNLIPTKAQVLLNRPELKKKYQKIGATIKNVAYDLREFLLDPKTRFPIDIDDKKHWQKIQDEGAELAAHSEVNYRLELMQERGVEPLPDYDDVARQVGVDNVLRFMMRVAVLRGQLKMDADPEDETFFRDMIEACMEEAIADSGTFDEVEKNRPEENKPRMGMVTRDLVLKRRKQ